VGDVEVREPVEHDQVVAVAAADPGVALERDRREGDPVAGRAAEDVDQPGAQGTCEQDRRSGAGAVPPTSPLIVIRQGEVRAPVGSP
jgi:hypothetical protein